MNSRNMRYVAVLFILFACTIGTYAQKKIDIKLERTSSRGNQNCFDISLRSPFGEDIDLAGQNYRLFYDASKVTYVDESISSKLSSAAYTAFDIQTTVLGSIGFLSFSTDARKLNDHTIRLSREGEWNSTAKVCFESEHGRFYDLTWARLDKTAHYASASIAFSEWINDGFQQVLESNDVMDVSFVKEIDASTFQGEVRMFPNPTADFVNVELRDDFQGYQNLIIKDVIGREVVYDQVNGRSTMYYDLTNWPDGLYTVEIANQKGDIIYRDNVIKANH